MKLHDRNAPRGRYRSPASPALAVPTALSRLSVLLPSVLALLAGSSLSAAEWTGTTGNWTDAVNWDTTDYPGFANDGAAVTIDSSSAVVTLGTDLPNPIGDGFTNQFVLKNGTLNIQADMTSNSYSNFGSYGQYTINQTAGTWTQDFRYDTGTNNSGTPIYNSAHNLSGGSFSMTNNDYRFGYTTNSNGADYSMNVSGSGSYAFGKMAMRQGVIHVSGGSVNSTGTINMNEPNAANVSSRIWIDGSVATAANFTTIDAFSTAGESILKYTLDASGVLAMDVDTLNLNSGTDISILEIDASAWDGVSGLNGNSIVLADYATLNGTFSSTNITGLSGATIDYEFDQGGGDLALAITIPEPSAFALIAGGLGAFVVLRRRRA